jgi:two-component system phosphate regulon response regulator PhoB
MRELILIVDDEPDITAALEFALQREGFETAVAHTGAEAVTLALRAPPALILLDLMLPDMPGTEVFRRLRSDTGTAQTPIVMVTARGDEIDRIVGFELGADDYIIKPFSTRELVLRVRAVLRRVQPDGARPEQLEMGPYTIDLGAHRVWSHGTEVDLTTIEFKLLATLAERTGRVQSRQTLLEDVWDIKAAIETRTVDTHVKRLRQKVGDDGSWIQTVRGIGYRLAEPRKS